MWFWLSLIALLFWSGSDLFSKIGCRDGNDKLSYLKMVSAVGLVMGLHAAYEIFIGGTEISWQIILTYLPVSLLYIVSMAIGYISLRYIELSISSPICNSSGAIVAIIYFIKDGFSESSPLQIVATALIVLGIVALGFVESNEDEELRIKRQMKSNYRYAKSMLAIILPLIYCLLDAAGTFADSIVLNNLDEGSANVAYELTFLFAGAIAFIAAFVIRRSKPSVKKDGAKLLGAVFETAGQFAYIYAIGDEKHVMFAAPMISAYCVVSVLWSRLLLKERLTLKHYLSIATVIVGIVILGVFDI